MFVRYESPRQYVRMYPVTTLLIGINAVVFLLLTVSGGSTDTNTLLRFGAMVNAAPYQTEYWRYAAAMFLHIGFEHLLFNAFALLVFAPPLESILGSRRYFLFYIASGIMANIAGVLLQHNAVLSAGASGAIYGVYGAYLYIGLFQKADLDRGSRTTIITLIVTGFLYSVAVPQISLIGHSGGFAAGFILYHLLKRSIK